MSTPRRGFLRALAVTPLAPRVLAQTPAAPTPPASPPPLTGDDAVAEALAETVRRQFGLSLDADEMVAIRREIAGSLGSSARLHAASRLTNADGPVNRFQARPPQTRGRPARP